MAGVVASNARNIRAKSLSLKDTREETEVLKKLQIRQEQVEANNQWKQKVLPILFYSIFHIQIIEYRVIDLTCWPFRGLNHISVMQTTILIVM